MVGMLSEIGLAEKPRLMRSELGSSSKELWSSARSSAQPRGAASPPYRGRLDMLHLSGATRD
jgi:hypothetical protein